MTEHAKKAGELFHDGHNCAQAVFAAFTDVTGIDEKTSLMLSSSFGGGMGRMREVCGAVSGAFMVLGVLYGNCEINDDKKKEHYALIREAADKFRKENGSIICRELLDGVVKDTSNDPEKRTVEYYEKRPCREYVEMAAQIVDDYIAQRGLSQ